MVTWTLALGALGGLLSGLMSDSKQVWPRLIDVGRRQPLPCVGLIGNMMIGCAAGELLRVTFFGIDSEFVTANGLTWSNAGAYLLCSFLASSAISGYTDRRFLRLAIRNAAMAPAADPATVHALDAATPYEAYVATGKLAPPLIPIWRTRGERVVAVAPGRLRELTAIGSKTSSRFHWSESP